MREFRTFLLDVDGTLVDSNGAHADAWAEVLAKHGHPIDPARVRPLIGLGGDRLVEELTGLARDSAANKQIGDERKKLFLSHYLSQVRPLEGARDLLVRLRDLGRRYAIASAAKEDELDPLLEIAGITDLVDVKTTSSDVDESKPDPEVIQAALRELSASADGAVMVGDTPYDLKAATEAGIPCIGFTSGGWSREQLYGCIAMYAGPAELARALQ